MSAMHTHVPLQIVNKMRVMYKGEKWKMALRFRSILENELLGELSVILEKECLY